MSQILRLPLFAGLDAEALGRITAGASEISLRSGTVIYRRGDSCKGLYVVVQGQVKLALHTPHGTEKVVELVGAGGCIGETTIVRGRPHLLTAETIADTRLVLLAKTSALAELERTPVFARSLISTLGDRLQHMIAAFEDCMLRSGTERVIGYLLNRLPAGAGDGGASIALAVKKGIIASQMNLTQEHFSRILRDLATQRLIEVRGRSVHVPDIARLRAQASDAGVTGRIHRKRRRSAAVEGGSADCDTEPQGVLAVHRFDDNG